MRWFHRIVDDHHLQVPTVLLIMQASRQEYPRMFLISAAHPKSQGTSNHRKFRKMKQTIEKRCTHVQTKLWWQQSQAIQHKPTSIPFSEERCNAHRLLSTSSSMLYYLVHQFDENNQRTKDCEFGSKVLQYVQPTEHLHLSCYVFIVYLKQGRKEICYYFTKMSIQSIILALLP